MSLFVEEIILFFSTKTGETRLETLLTMSTQEISRLEVMQRLADKHMKQANAAQLLNISVRQVKRLYKTYKQFGAQGLISKKRGKPSGRKIPDANRQAIIDLISSHYRDFGPTLACEKLLECHDIKVGVETTRQIMIDQGLWKTRSQLAKRTYQPRNRRDFYGELIQIDGSDHDWFEYRAPRCTLLVYIDDATSKLMKLRFVNEESTFAYFEATEAYLKRHGKPIAFYSDKHSIFRVNQKGNAGKGDRITQFGRALSDLNIDIICANTSQAKGRVERANKTLQDRLVKELRLRGISDMTAANQFLPEFIESYNTKFAKPPIKDADLHRPLMVRDLSQLSDTFCWQEERTLSNNLTLQYDKVMYLIEDTLENRKLKRKRVTVYDSHKQEVVIKHDDRILNYKKQFDKLRQVEAGDIVDNKRLSHILRVIQG